MRIKFIILTVIILFTGCSFKTSDKYKYRVDASNSFESFKKYYLQGKTRLASIALKRALQNAKAGSDINSIAKIYLGECALHNAMLIKDNCSEFAQIKDIINDKTIQNYYLFLIGDFQKIDTQFLSKQYRDFTKYLKQQDIKNAIKALHKIKDIDSQIIAASLIKNKLSKKDVKDIIKSSSSMGYKKATARWYKFLMKKSTADEKRVIEKKLKLFQ